MVWSAPVIPELSWNLQSNQRKRRRVEQRFDIPFKVVEAWAVDIKRARM